MRFDTAPEALDTAPTADFSADWPSARPEPSMPPTTSPPGEDPPLADRPPEKPPLLPPPLEFVLPKPWMRFCAARRVTIPISQASQLQLQKARAMVQLAAGVP